MSHKREESAKERALELSQQKDALELEMNAIYESLNVSSFLPICLPLSHDTLAPI